MTKTLDTLIQDIYSTLEKGVDVSQPSVQEALDEVGSLVREATETVLREGERTGASNLRLSQIGKPDRQIWYGAPERCPSGFGAADFPRTGTQRIQRAR